MSESKAGVLLAEVPSDRQRYFVRYLTAILIDLLVSTILMSLGMMMMPPVVVSAPVKLLVFVLVDGWRLIVENLGMSFL